MGYELITYWSGVHSHNHHGTGALVNKLRYYKQFVIDLLCHSKKTPYSLTAIR